MERKNLEILFLILSWCFNEKKVNTLALTIQWLIEQEFTKYSYEELLDGWNNYKESPDKKYPIAEERMVLFLNTLKRGEFIAKPFEEKINETLPAANHGECEKIEEAS